MGLEKIAIGLGKTIIKKGTSSVSIPQFSGSAFKEASSAAKVASKLTVTTDVFTRSDEIIPGTIKQIKSLLKFNKCSTIEEAKTYAQTQLGMKIFEVQDIDTANCLLEMLTDIHNKCGDVGLTSLKYVEKIRLKTQPRGDIVGLMNYKTGETLLACRAEEATLGAVCGKYAQTHPELIPELLQELSKLDNPNISSLFLLETFRKKHKFSIQRINEIPFQTLKHEIAHRLHYLKCKAQKVDYDSMGKKHEITALGGKNFNIYNEFKSQQIQQILKDFSFIGDYAKESPCEFVAELYPVLLEEIKVPKKILDLYIKYHGPSVHNSKYNIV